MQRIAILAVVVAGLAPAGSLRARAEQPADQVAIIVNRANPVDDLTEVELRNILLLDRQSWPHSKKITVVMREERQVDREFILREVCGMSDADFARHLLQTTFRGSVTSGPRTINSAEGMRRFVFNVPGAVGYVRADQVDDTVKVLRIDGRLPGERGYPLSAAPAPPKPRS